MKKYTIAILFTLFSFSSFAAEQTPLEEMVEISQRISDRIERMTKINAEVNAQLISIIAEHKEV